MSPESFYARPGYIKVDLEIDNLMTYSILTTYTFTITCEHAIPKEGLLVIELADTMEFTSNVQVSGLSLKEFNTTVLSFDMGSGYYAEDTISFSISGIRNPRSFAPNNEMHV